MLHFFLVVNKYYSFPSYSVWFSLLCCDFELVVTRVKWGSMWAWLNVEPRPDLRSAVRAYSIDSHHYIWPARHRDVIVRAIAPSFKAPVDWGPYQKRSNFPNNFPSGLKVDRAHQIGTQSSLTCPHTLIAKIHHFSEKEKILKLTCLQSPLSFNGARVSIYPDFPPEISEQRRAYDRVKKKLREAGIRHGLLFPAC